MGRGFLDPFKQINGPVGIDLQISNDFSIIKIHPIRCGLALGRLVFLFTASIVWLGVGLFFGIAMSVGNGDGEVLIWSILFLCISLITIIAIVLALASETIVISKYELIFTKQLGLMLMTKRIKLDWIEAVAMGKLQRLGEDEVSIDTVSIIYKKTSTGNWKNLFVGYSLNAHYRCDLYNILIRVFENIG